MNPASAQKRIAFGYNRDGNEIVINEGQAAPCVRSTNPIIFWFLRHKRLLFVCFYDTIRLSFRRATTEQKLLWAEYDPTKKMLRRRCYL